jgi:hypothetical protein
MYNISVDQEIASLRQQFEGCKDLRSSNACHKLPDIMMSAFAIYHLKYSSLLNFEEQTEMERANLKTVYGIEKVCSDATMRRVLDVQNPDFIRDLFPKKFVELKKKGILTEYAYKIGKKDYFLVATDGVQHFSSQKVSCAHCLTQNHSNGTTTYHHNLSCTVLVHPARREVFPLAVEPIVLQDGATKQDCELNAAKRLQRSIHQNYPLKERKTPFLFVEDALYANVPHLKTLLANGHHYLLNVKPDSHKTLFGQLTGKAERGLLKKWTITTLDQTNHSFEYTSKILLFAGYPDFRTNFIKYTQTTVKGKTTTFTWITDVPVTPQVLMQLMRAARCRWKIENETFNTLKNQGYHFEHNFGHGNQHLCTFLAYLMLYAFYMDQLVQIGCHLFKNIETYLQTKKKLWQTMRALFSTTLQKSMHAIYYNIATLFNIPIAPT